jgi:hypothetical protein
MTPSAPTVVAPSGAAATATPLKGGAIALSPLPLSGGRRRSRKLSKKAKKALRTLKKMGGDEIEEAVAPAVAGADEMVPAVEGARRRKSRRGTRKSRKSRRSGLFY